VNKSKIVKVPSSCSIPEGLTSAGDGSVWLRCATSGLATPKLLRVTDSGAVKEFSLAKVTAIGDFAAGKNGSMWAVGYNAKGQSAGLVEFSSAGKESYFGSPGGYTAQRVAGNGTGRVIEIAKRGSGLTYLSVSASGGLKRVASEPGSAAGVSATFGPAMDPHGNVWTMQTGTAVKTHEYFLELTSGNKVKAYSFTLPGGCNGTQLALTGSMAASSDGSAWGESQSNCVPIGMTRSAYIGGIVRYLS
jgi:hypothetical protein